MVAFWAVMTSHCSLESVPGFEFLACAPEPVSAPHQASDCAEDADACSTVESGSYRSEDVQDLVTGPILVAAIVSEALPGSTCDLGIRLRVKTTSADAILAWQFVQRTALPPRAPNALS